MDIDIRSKFFGTQQVLGKISLSAAIGEVIAVTGPSGIGKSTFVRMIAGLEKQYDGQITNAGQIGFVFQEPTLLPWRNLLDNISLVTGCDQTAAQAALDRVELGDRALDFPGQLSLGQQRRVALARALAANPQTLILDEAFASLDEETAKRMHKLLKRVLSENSFVTFLVTHNLEEAVEMADRVLVLGGAPATILLDHRIETGTPKGNLHSQVKTLREKLDKLR